jgi:hypothetical protein
MRTPAFVIIIGFVLSAPVLQAQDRSRYRDFQLGSDLPSVAALAKVSPSAAKTIHQRPAVIQELEWRPPYVMSGATLSQNDPVQRIVFSFYDDQLFKLVIGYDRQRTNGLTDRDMIDAISETYGPAVLPTLKTLPAVPRADPESGTLVAQWGDPDYSVALYRSSFASEFRVIVASPRLEGFARTAVMQAIRLDENEAPEREIARQKKEADDIRASQEKARLANKAAFRP